MPICECGAQYKNFCVRCKRREREEEYEELMDSFGLTDERLIEKLAFHVLDDDNYPALSKAIDLKGMKPSTKAEISGEPIEKFSESTERINAFISRFSKRD